MPVRSVCCSFAIIAVCLATCLLRPLSLQALDESAKVDSEVSKLLQTFRDEFVAIKPGTKSFPESFRFGAADDKLAVDVKLLKPFEISKYEMYQSLYEAVMGNNPSRWKGSRNSVEQLSYADAGEFCKKVTILLRAAKLIEANQSVRLPTEVEWEYCARAGTTTRYSFGDEAQNKGDVENLATLLDPFAWHTGNAAGNDPEVGVLKPNPWGLYDVHGYLWELCEGDWSDSVKDVAADPHTPYRNIDAAAAMAVMRGGSWKDKYTALTSSSRSKFLKTTGRDDAVGFRCVLIQD